MKVDGSAKFGLDMRVPGMLFAVIARPPVVGAKIVNVNDSAARAIAGVVDVKVIPAGVAVYATNTWAAKRGRDALEIDWDEGAQGSFSTAAQRARVSAAAERTPGAVARETGDVKAALAGAAKRSTWNTNCPISRIRPWSRSIVSPTCARTAATCGSARRCNRPTAMRSRASSASIRRRCSVHTTFLGGGFGRRAQRYSDVVRRSRAALEGHRQTGAERLDARRRRARAVVSPAS